MARNLLVTFHPVTLEANDSLVQLDALLGALDALQDTRLIFTLPNADAGNRAIASASKNSLPRIPMRDAWRRSDNCVISPASVTSMRSSAIRRAACSKRPASASRPSTSANAAGRPRASSVVHCDASREGIAMHDATRARSAGLAVANVDGRDAQAGRFEQAARRIADDRIDVSVMQER